MKKRADGRYCMQITIGYDENGRRKTKNIYGTSKQDVRHRAELFKDELKKGTAIINENITVSEWTEEWLKTYKTGLEYNTMEMYYNSVNNHIIPSLGSMKLKSLKKVHIQHLLNDLIDSGKLSTASKVRLTINQILNQAVENELIYKNVAAGIKLPKKEKPSKRALTDFEKELISKSELSLEERLFIKIMLYAGLRRGEALALTQNDIDLENRTISVNKTVIFKGNTPEIKNTPKSDAGNRIIPVIDVLYDDLKVHMDNLENIFLFTMKNNQIVSKSSFRKMWDRTIKKLNTAAGGTDHIKALATDITPHIFRHTYATMLYYAGVDLKTAQYLLGHASIQMTLDIYTHLDSEQNTTAQDKLNAFVNGKIKNVS